jgi:ligand-binding sensor domain-containing protein
MTLYLCHKQVIPTMNPKFNSILFVIFLLLSKFILGQEVALVYHNYTTEDGLPSSEVYKSFQDEQGFMWFCTDRGLSKFNGFEFINYTEEDGLSDNVVLDYHIEKPGKVWLICNNGSLSILENGKIRPYKFNNLIAYQRIKDLNIINDTLFIGTVDYNSFFIDSKGNISRLEKENQQKYIIYDQKIDLLYAGATRENSNKHILERRKDELFLKCKLDGSEIIYEIDSSWAIHVQLIKHIQINDHLFCLNIGKHLLFFDHQKFLYKIELPSRILFSSFQYGSIWIGTLNNGGYELNYDNDKFKIYKHYLQDKSVTSFSIDSDQSIWITTLSNGIYYSINPYIILPHSSNNSINMCVNTWAIDSTLFTMSIDNQFYAISTKKDSIIYRKELKENKLYANVLNNKMKVFLRDSGYISYYFDNSTNELKLNDNYFNNITSNKVCAAFLTSGKHNERIHTDFWNIYKSDNELDTITKLFQNRIYKIDNDRDTNLWIACESGLYKYDYETVIPIADLRFTDFYFNKKSIIGASRGRGLFYFNNGASHFIDENQGLISNQINSITRINDTLGWAASNKGFTKFCVGNSVKTCFSNYTSQQGLISTEIQNVVSSGGFIYISSKKGLMKIEKDKLKNDFSSSLLLNKISINGSVLDEISTIQIQKNNLVLDSELLSMEIELSPICLNCLNQQQLKASINGNTQKFSDNRLILNSLKPGEYNIKFWIKNGQDQWVEANFEINFTIPTPFWQSTWFSLIIILLIVIVLFLIIFNFILFYKKNQLEKHKLIEYQQSALILQMKPHFIFNALNSIQSEVLSGDKFETHKFISKFGLLMRKNLEYSDREFILLEEEIDLIKMYTELENKRLNFPFQFIVDIGAGVNLSDSKIPPFILQPIIENCIWHGLTSSDIKDGEIHLKISIIDECLRIVITDNGIGLETSLKNKKNTHVSKGTLILQKRIELLEKQYNFKSSYSLKDRKHFNSRGTIIQITLPLIK